MFDCNSMNQMETFTKEQLIKSVNSIKNKLKLIHDEDDAANLKYKKVFKPITDPLETLIKVNERDTTTSKLVQNKNNTIDDLNSSIECADLLMDDSDTGSEYYSEDEKSSYKNDNDTLISLKKDDVIDIYDNINIPFGIRSENKKLMMGNKKVKISLTKSSFNTDKVYIISIDDKHYELTNGLQELLIRNKPNLALVTETDKIVYKDMLSITNAHKRDYNPDGQIKGDKGLKYRQIIKPLFKEDSVKKCFRRPPIIKKTGGYIPKYKKYKKNTDYVYWDDPNELIERLKLLIASQSAGNTNHDNEIISIVEELKEAGIIKG